MIDPSIQHLISDDNPIIKGTGTASFGKDHYCIWCTSNGSTSICNIQNPSEDTLSFVVSGAPTSIYTTTGKVFNGLHAIPPNQPTSNVTAIGDFQGVQVSVFNLSATDATCQVSTYSPPGRVCDDQTSIGRRIFGLLLRKRSTVDHQHRRTPRS